MIQYARSNGAASAGFMLLSSLRPKFRNPRFHTKLTFDPRAGTVDSLIVAEGKQASQLLYTLGIPTRYSLQYWYLQLYYWLLVLRSAYCYPLAWCGYTAVGRTQYYRVNCKESKKV